MIKMLPAAQPSIIGATKNTDRNSIGSAYQAIPCNPFKMAFFSILNNSASLPQSMSDLLKQILSTGERKFKVVIQDRLLMQKTAITEKISMTMFPLLNMGLAMKRSRGAVYE